MRPFKEPWNMVVMVMVATVVFTNVQTRKIRLKPREVATSSTATGRKAKMMEWRRDILHGVSVLPKHGTPGRIIVYGTHAEPILTGNSERDVLVAAAEFGRGRIVTISHTGYCDTFSQDDKNETSAMNVFHRNLKKWLTRGTFEKNSDIIGARNNVDMVKLTLSKIVFYDGEEVNINPSDLTEYVRNGGSLLYCETPWRWKTQSHSRAPYSTLLSEAGFYLTDEYIYEDESGFSVENNKASDAHFSRILEGTDLKKTMDQLDMLKRLKSVPVNTFPQMKRLVETLLEVRQKELESSMIPSKTNQVTDEREKAILNLWLLCFDLLQPQNLKAPGVELFPLDFLSDPTLKLRELTYYSERREFYPTAFYLPAGQTLKIEIVSGNKDGDWELMVGCHTDELKNAAWKRWPKVNTRIRLEEQMFELTTPFGGLIYLISPNNSNQNIRIRLENVVESPRFRLTEGKKGKNKWKRRRRAPGLWADIVGKYSAFTFPSASIREMGFGELTYVMRIWDSVVRSFHDLRGTDVSSYQRMWIVTDEQPSAGYMHAGYPIVTHLDVADPKTKIFLLNSTTLVNEGNWGVFHEIGHNMERDDWTFEGTGDVTNNIFSLFAMDNVSNIKPWNTTFVRDQLKDAEQFFKAGANFQKWKSSTGIALFVYVQLAHEFGWDSYRKVFRRYEAMKEIERPTNDQEKRDKWFTIFSETVRFNLAPLASFWNIPLSTKAVNHLSASFPVGFLPDDEVTRMAPGRVADIRRRFRRIVRKA